MATTTIAREARPRRAHVRLGFFERAPVPQSPCGQPATQARAVPADSIWPQRPSGLLKSRDAIYCPGCLGLTMNWPRSSIR